MNMVEYNITIPSLTETTESNEEVVLTTTLFNSEADPLDLTDNDLTNKLLSEVNMPFCMKEKILPNIDIEISQIDNSQDLLPYTNSDLINIKQEVNEEDIKTEIITEEFDISPVKYETDFLSYYHSTEFQQPRKKNTATKIFKKKKYLCPVCQKSFAYPRSRSNHFICHFGGHDAKYNGKFSVGCFTCRKTFSTKEEIAKHLFEHVNNETVHTKPKKIDLKGKQLRCTICDMEFSQKTHLQNHTKLHSTVQTHNIKPFVCFICSKQYRHRRTLDLHMMLHSGEKPFKCTICTKQYSWKTTLARHIQQIHPNEISSVDTKLDV